MNSHRLFPKGFIWAGGIENTFVPHAKPGLRSLDEFELTQHYQRWREDLKLAADAGIKVLRWGFPWYKVEPERGRFDFTWADEVLEYMVLELGIEPILDLVHYGTPDWLEDGFLNPEYPERVAVYARAAQWPPYASGDTGYCQVLAAIARGIQKTASAIREEVPGAVLVAVEAMGHARLSDNRPPTLKADAERFSGDLLPWDLVVGRVKRSHPRYQWLIDNGVSERALLELEDNGVMQDILGVNMYPWSIEDLGTDDEGALWRHRSKDDNGACLELVLRRIYKYVGRPMMITETSADGDRRASWMMETLSAVSSAIKSGIPVVGYTWFPIITMINWDYRTSDKPLKEFLLHLGLWECRFDGRGNLIRHSTPLVDKYSRLIETSSRSPRWLTRAVERARLRLKRLSYRLGKIKIIE